MRPPQPLRTAMLRLAMIDMVIAILFAVLPASSPIASDASLWVATPPTSRKRGLALKSDSVCADLALFSSLRPWFYGWGSAPSSSDYSKCANQHDSGFIPMIWGRRAVSVDVWPNAAALLGFNEPNHKQQSNLQPAEAARLWPSVMHAAHEAGIARLGSPAAAPCGGGSRKCVDDVLPWLDEFFGNCSNCTVDFIATHSYVCQASKLRSFLEGLYERYRLPIWLTEFNCGDGSRNASAKEHLQYMKEAVPLLESLPFVERYAWMSARNTHDVGAALVYGTNSTSNLTTLGEWYAQGAV
jgi:hypothetical protein